MAASCLWSLCPASMAAAAAGAAGLAVGYCAGRWGHRPRLRRDGSMGAAAAGGDVEIYVGNLAPETAEESLRAEFERFGRVTSVRILAGRFQGRSKKFAFVIMAARREAEAAIKAMHGREVGGRRLVVNEARNPRRANGRHD